MKYNSASHFYLYAKGWYEKTNLETDLRKIMSDYSAVKPELIDFRDIKSLLLTCAYYEINRKANKEHTFLTFISRVEQQNVLDACISLLSVAVNDPERPLLRPNDNILPISSGGLKEINNHVWVNQ